MAFARETHPPGRLKRSSLIMRHNDKSSDNKLKNINEWECTKRKKTGRRKHKANAFPRVDCQFINSQIEQMSSKCDNYLKIRYYGFSVLAM